jgi:hypothetical protein
MDDEPTCGKGVAENSRVPARMGELVDALAENLELHMGALDLSDPQSRMEYEAYRELAISHRGIAIQLKLAARRMAGYRDLPMGRHDTSVMASREVHAAFESFISAEEALLTTLHERLEQDRALLRQMTPLHLTG